MTHEEIEAAIKRMTCEGLSTYDGVMSAFMGTYQWRSDEVLDKLISLLNDADVDEWPDETLDYHGLMRLPVDADGEPIHIGDELISNHSKKKFIVTRLQYSRKHAWMIGGADKDDLSEYGLYAPCETRHYQPTVEELLFEFGKICQDGYDIGNSIHEYVEKIRELVGSDQ